MPKENTNQHILVVDDDQKVRQLLRDVFEGVGYGVSEAGGASEALGILHTQNCDLVTLDLQLGAEDGLDVARQIRTKSDIPIIMVTGRDDVVDRVVGLELGADDYITKPFHVREVTARVKAVLRRGKGAAVPARPDGSQGGSDNPTAYGFDGLVAVPDQFALYCRQGGLCDLTSGDFRLLHVFIQNPNRILSRDRLMDMTSGVDWTPLDRTIDNQVARLRKKIERNPAEPRLIKTVRGIGYIFAGDLTLLQAEDLPSNLDNRVARAP